MRNPTITKLFAEALFNFHYKSHAGEVVEQIAPKDRQNLQIDIIINEWAPRAIIRIAKIREKLGLNNGHQ